MDRIESKLRKFKKKFFFNEWIKGLLVTLIIGLVFLFVVIVLEYFGQFGTEVRKGLFFSSLGILLVLLIRYTVWPLFKWLSYERFFSDVDSAQVLRKKLPEINDELLSYLELKGMGDSELVKASADQKAKILDNIQFDKAVSFKENKKLFLLFLAPVLLFLSIGLSEWGTKFKESGVRIVEYTQEYLPVAPFQFINNTPTKVVANREMSFSLLVGGDYLSQNSFVVINETRISLQRQSKEEWAKKLLAPHDDFSFYFEVDGFKSKSFEVEVVSLPVVSDFSLEIIPPTYTKQPVKALKNVGDFQFYEGSKVVWSLKGKSIKNSWIKINNDSLAFSDQVVESTVKQSFKYQFFLQNDDSTLAFPIVFSAQAIKDLTPEIIDFSDSVNYELGVLEAYVEGQDDYGVKSIQWIGLKDTEEEVVLQSVRGNESTLSDYLLIDSIAQLVNDGFTSIVCRVFDNDAVHGSKFKQSSKIRLKDISLSEKHEFDKKRIEEQNQSISTSKKEFEKLQKSIESLQEQKNLSRNKNQKQKELVEKFIEETKKLEEKQKAMEEKLNKLDGKKDLENEKKLNELLEKLNDPELQEFLESLKEKAQEDGLDKSDMDQMNRELDYKVDQLKRLEELYKDAVFQMKLDQQIERVEEAIAKTEEALRTQDLQKQEEAEALTEEVKKEQEELIEKNQELSQEYSGLEKTQEKANSASENSKKATESQKKGKSSDSKKSKEQSKEDLEALQSLLSMMQSNMSQEKKKENIEHLEQLLDNVVWVSFKEEGLFNTFSSIDLNNPEYKEQLVEQGDLTSKLELVKDSLDNLMARVPELDPVLSKKVIALKSQQEKSLEALQDGQLDQGTRFQRDIMYNLNYIAWVLSDVLQQMRQDLANQQQGNQNCEKPGGSSSSPSASEMKNMQEKLGKEFGESNPTPGQKGKPDKGKNGKEKGEGEGKGSEGRSGKEIMEMLARQEMIRMELEKKNKGGENNGAIESMKEFERELLDPNISFEQKKERLREIETRLLEVEEAERTQEKEVKRESKNKELYMTLKEESKRKFLENKKGYKESHQNSPLLLQNFYQQIKKSYLNDSMD